MAVDQQLTDNLNIVDVEDVTRRYWEQGEFFNQPAMIDSGIIDQFMKEVEQLRSCVNRNYIPGHKKGGSVSYYDLQKLSPSILAFYQHPGWIQLLSHIAKVPLLRCPERDPHSCALYFYTEAGDHIGYHYDTSYYKGKRYTVLVGLRDESTSRLVCRLHTKENGKEVQEVALATDPGTFIFFNGDKLYHAVTPIQEGEERIVLTLQYLTDPSMGLAHRWFSNMKDAVGYFGWSAVFGKSPSSIR